MASHCRDNALSEAFDCAQAESKGHLRGDCFPPP